ncbi:MAG: hypothetical protein ACD_41C00020G0002 [uncultured bacterium]|nr:MAG: hypothetical protein ACD_41C00020G0002 [uncultured bacterium]HBY74023.1 zinc ABC transporter substrate-binding protein [Candidatus Kerfeldbacteria bacterium]
MKRILLGLSCLTLAATGCTTPITDTTQLQVAASFYPLAYMAEQVGGEYVTVTTIVPNGVEPHDFAPTPQDIVAMIEADVLVYNGAGLDNWATTESNGQIIFATDDSATDPHVWLDPVLMQDFVQAIADAYSAADPDHQIGYQDKADAVIVQLQNLNNSYQSRLANCELNQVIVAHDAFTYVAERYNIAVLPILGVNPNEAPSAKTLAELSALAKTAGIEYIFFEELTSPKLSETLAAEVGAQTLVLSPLEGLSEEEQAAGEDYFSISEQNLDNLALAMRCQ